MITYAAELQPIGWHGHDAPDPGSWFITHPIGGPAGDTYSEVAFTRDARFGAAAHERPDVVLDEVVRLVAFALYGSRWALHYAPQQYAAAIERYGLRRRERVVVTAIDVIPDNPPREDPRP